MFLCEASNTAQITTKEKLFSCPLRSAKIVQGPWLLLFPHLNTPQLLLWLFTWERQGGKKGEIFLPKIVFLTSLTACSAVSSDHVVGVTLLLLTTNKQS